MADRLIHILVPASQSDRLRDLIDRLDNVDCWHDPAGELALFAVQVPAEQVECVLDPVQASFGITEGFRAVVLPVEAILPREEETGGGGPVEQDKPKSASRISREELHADLGGNTRITPVFLTMVVLSTIVAAVGLANDSPAIVIGAMVMAPLLGPNMALSLATTLGDGTLAVRALRANGTGLLLAVFVALVCGLLLDVDPCAKEISCRIHVGPVDLVIALAAGVGGALAFTSGVPSSLIGVMVAVALLPPLVLFAMLLAGGHAREAVGALLLFGSNVISVNLAGVATFLVQGVSPRSWWEAQRSKRMTRVALIIWVTLLVAVSTLVLVSHHRQRTDKGTSLISSPIDPLRGCRRCPFRYASAPGRAKSVMSPCPLDAIPASNLSPARPSTRAGRSALRDQFFAQG